MEQIEKEDFNFYISTLLNAMQLLTEKQRKVINLRIQGLPLSEIGAINFLTPTGAADVLNKAYKVLDRAINLRKDNY